MNGLFKFILSTSVGDLWLKFAILLLILLFLLRRKRLMQTAKYEGFQQKEHFIVKNGADVYDEFYAPIYDMLNLNKTTINNIVDTVIKNTQANEYSYILDINAKTGIVCNLFNKNGMKCSGIERSRPMVEYAKYKYGNDIDIVQHTEYENTMLYDSGVFSHVVCLGMDGFYGLDERVTQQKILFNVHKWLKCGGYFVVQLVDWRRYNMMADNLYGEGVKQPENMTGGYDGKSENSDSRDKQEEEKEKEFWDFTWMNILKERLTFPSFMADYMKMGKEDIGETPQKINKVVIDYGDFEYKCEIVGSAREGGSQYGGMTVNGNKNCITKLETFTDKKSGNIRKNEIEYYGSRNLEEDIRFIESCGFSQKGKIQGDASGGSGSGNGLNIYIFQKMDVVDFI